MAELKVLIDSLDDYGYQDFWDIVSQTWIKGVSSYRARVFYNDKQAFKEWLKIYCPECIVAWPEDPSLGLVPQMLRNPATTATILLDSAQEAMALKLTWPMNR